MSRVIEAVLPVRAGERRLTLLLFFQNLLVVGAFVAGRSARDALFLAGGEVGRLGWMFAAAALAVAVAGAIHAPLAARVRRDRLAQASALLFAAGFVALWFAQRMGGRAAIEILYVYVEVVGALTVVQFWTLTNELFNAREARRLYGLVGAGGMLANVAVGLVTARIAIGFGAEALLWLCAALLLGGAGASWATERAGRQRLFARAAARGRVRAAKVRGAAGRVLASGHLRALAALTAITFFTINLVDFQFKVVAAEALPRDQLAAFFGYLYSAVGALAFGLQLVGTGRILDRAGVIGALAILPVALIGGSALFAAAPILATAALLKGAESLFRYSVNDPTSQLLYLPAAPAARASAKAFVDGVVKPASVAAAGLVLVGYGGWLGERPVDLAWLCIALCGGWLGLVAALRPRYLKSLQETLRRPRPEVGPAWSRLRDGSTARVLGAALEGGDARAIADALSLLPRLKELDLDDRVEPLLQHEAALVREGALAYFRARPSARHAEAIRARFDDPEPGVRAAAVDAFCALERDGAVPQVRRFLADPDPGVRGRVVAAMIRDGGLEGVVAASEALKGLIAHPDPAMRLHAARALGAVGVVSFHRPVQELLGDPDGRVRREAIGAAAILRGPDFVVPLVELTRSPDTRREAIEALACFGPEIAPVLATALGNPLEPSAVRGAAARVLGRMATPEAMEILGRAMGERDDEVRTQVYRALGRAVKARRFLKVDRRAMRAALDRELRRAHRVLVSAAVLRLGAGPGPGTPREGPEAAAALLSSALAEEAAASERRVFLVLAILYPEAEMEHIYASVRDASAEGAPRRRANAVELLDTLLDRELKQRVLPLVEDLPRAGRLRALEELFPGPRPAPEEVLDALCRDGVAWLRACALHYASAAEPEVATRALVEATSDPDPVVREVAVLARARAPNLGRASTRR